MARLPRRSGHDRAGSLSLAFLDFPVQHLQCVLLTGSEGERPAGRFPAVHRRRGYAEQAGELGDRESAPAAQLRHPAARRLEPGRRGAGPTRPPAAGAGGVRWSSAERPPRRCPPGRDRTRASVSERATACVSSIRTRRAAPAGSALSMSQTVVCDTCCSAAPTSRRPTAPSRWTCSATPCGRPASTTRSTSKCVKLSYLAPTGSRASPCRTPRAPVRRRRLRGRA